MATLAATAPAGATSGDASAWFHPVVCAVYDLTIDVTSGAFDEFSQTIWNFEFTPDAVPGMLNHPDAE